MKGLKIYSLLILFSVSFISIQAQSIDTDSTDTHFKHAVGAGAGYITGYGLSYRYMPTKYGIQVNFAPYHDAELDRYSLGVTFIYRLIKNKISSLYVYEGNHYYYNSQLIYTYDPNKIDPTINRVKTNYFNNGIGFGIEIIIAKRIGLNLMTGYAFYNNFNQVNITGEAALYYKF